MNFLVDAQLPRRMVLWLSTEGCSAVHALELASGNRTIDEQIIEEADREYRVLVTKDQDFVDSHVLHGKPAKLLLISTGNISNRDFRIAVYTSDPEHHSRIRSSFSSLGVEGSSFAAELYSAAPSVTDTSSN